MEKLINELQNKIKLSKYKKELSKEFLESLYSVYPFNEFEYIISHLISENLIDINNYYHIRNEYLVRNKYLHIFEITAPRTFGENWAQNHLNELVQELEHPSTSLDPSYNGEYDFWYNGIKIEVKASRAVKRATGESLIYKALCSDSRNHFDMNFQQIKPKCCDVFIWIAVWRDVIKYWVLSSDEVTHNKYYSKGQHRGNTGEGQLWIKDTNINEFEEYRVEPRDILNKIIEKANKHKFI